MIYDVAIIGGGPAGMIAAGRAAELGARTLLLEKNSRLGIKLLITGHGRCNITNLTDSPREFAEKFNKNGKFLLSALSRFGARDVIEFFERRGVKTKVEKNSRVITQSDRAEDVLNALIAYMKKGKVEVRPGSQVSSIIGKDGRIEKIALASGKEVFADKFVISTGGKSYPQTGSTGDGFEWARKLGHTIVTPTPALTPVLLTNPFVADLEGLSLRDVRFGAFKDAKKIDSNTGEAVFTARGLSGPLAINMSNIIGRALPGKVELKIDLLPQFDYIALDERLRADFSKTPNKLIKNCLDALLPQKIIPVILKLARIDAEKKVKGITKEERKKLIHLVKEFTLQVAGLPGFEKAIITAGGIDLKEVDSKTMRSKIIENLYFAGEVLDLDGPSGGYNLQVCWSTGYVAGESIKSSDA